ncbi:membrane-associated guanylate kinase, WW and PDZ domain-containing protein 2-like, partial [Gymnodraco acuticeps]|uniref:Membrane-associated guanylate kinase, WW and PDZ domain-containing protein 2-like n=1 Tax=Gymnodraco acuticeps TaxID=8218 RepID=A0A6P8UY50_GYMAC
MSKTLKKRKNHWTNKVHESVLCRNEEGELGLELKGGAENGQFPVIGELLPGTAVCHSGKLWTDELLLEVNDTPGGWTHHQGRPCCGQTQQRPPSDSSVSNKRFGGGILLSLPPVTLSDCQAHLWRQ